jgi:hypothetical protein
MFVGLLAMVSVAAAPAPSSNAETPHESRMAVAKSFATCVGVYQFVGNMQASQGKPGTKELFDQYANGAHSAALWVYETDWVADHPGEEPPVYGKFSPNVESIAELERVRLAARWENGDAQPATAALTQCTEMAPRIEKALAQLRKEVPGLADMGIAD